jgi:antitoxin MazE
MQSAIMKWGNSLALRVPASMAKSLDLVEGAPVALLVSDGKLIVEPVKVDGETLDEMLDRIAPENLHELIDFGRSVGKEW